MINTIMRVLIAYDGSEDARIAIEDLRRAGLPRETHATIVSIAEAVLSPPPTSTESGNPTDAASRRVTAHAAQMQKHAADEFAKAEAHAVEARKKLESLFASWHIEIKISAGSPAWEIINLADDWQADLIVTGSHGRSALGRLIMGSVSTRIAHEARCSVRIGRSIGSARNTKESAPETPSAQPARLIIGMDSSANSQFVLEALTKREWAKGTTARLITVSNPPEPTLAASVETFASGLRVESYTVEKERVRRMIDDAANVLNNAGIETTAEVMSGNPQRILLNEAERIEADCIFVGSRNLSGMVERFTLGSVSSGIAKNADCSVEVVKIPG